jgi:hypothetical protein
MSNFKLTFYHFKLSEQQFRMNRTAQFPIDRLKNPGKLRPAAAIGLKLIL